MLKKKSILLGLLLTSMLIVSACSDKETSTESKDTTEAKSEVLMVSGDTVTEQGGCVLASRFTTGDKIIFRMNAIDSNTNEQDKDAKLTLNLSTGEKLDMKYGKHGDDNFWVVAYPVTAETPTGTLDYFVTAENGDLKGEYRPFNVAPSLLTIVDASAVNGEAAPEEKKEEPKAEEPKTDETAVKTNQKVDIIATDFKFNEKKYFVKAGEEATLKLTSKEGTHGIMVEGLNVSIDKPNGTVKFTPKKAGEYKILCSVFCGAGHGDMTATLVVVE